MASQRIAGIITVTANNGQLVASGEWTYGLGGTKRTTKVSANAVIGFTGEVKIPFIEGTVTDQSDFDFAAFCASENVTVQLALYNGKNITLKGANYVSDGVANAMTGDLEARFEGVSAQEVTA